MTPSSPPDPLNLAKTAFVWADFPEKIKIFDFFHETSDIALFWAE